MSPFLTRSFLVEDSSRYSLPGKLYKRKLLFTSSYTLFIVMQRMQMLFLTLLMGPPSRSINHLMELCSSAGRLLQMSISGPSLTTFESAP